MNAEPQHEDPAADGAGNGGPGAEKLNHRTDLGLGKTQLEVNGVVMAAAMVSPIL